MLDSAFASWRRAVPRSTLSARCWEVANDEEQRGIVTDLSWEGIRLERPFVAGARANHVQLEIDVPGLGEVIWAKAGARFDLLVPAPKGSSLGGPMGLIRRTGFRLMAAASRDLRMLRDFLFERQRAEASRRAERLERAGAKLPSIVAHPTLGAHARAHGSEQSRAQA